MAKYWTYEKHDHFLHIRLSLLEMFPLRISVVCVISATRMDRIELDDQTTYCNITEMRPHARGGMIDCVGV